MKYYARLGDKTYECTLDARNGDLFVEVDGRRYRADLRHLAQSFTYSLLLDGRSYEFALHAGEDEVELSGGAGLFHVAVEDARTHAARAKTVGARAESGPRPVKAVMPGIVRELLVAVGDSVTKGQALLILEAMKMQNEIRADHDGRVTKISVAAGDTVDKGEKLVEIE